LTAQAAPLAVERRHFCAPTASNAVRYRRVASAATEKLREMSCSEKGNGVPASVGCRPSTKDKQHLGMHMNYDADLFAANRL
jgi:hypothetical protein